MIVVIMCSWIVAPFISYRNILLNKNTIEDTSSMLTPSMNEPVALTPVFSSA